MKAWPILLLLGAAATGCMLPTEGQQADFGAEFRVEEAPDPPVLSEGVLTVTVSYGACGVGREFKLRHHVVRPGKATLWIQKTTPDEPCRMLVIERLTFAVPEAVAQSAEVTLLTPAGHGIQL